MRIAVTYENGQIFQHFGRTEQFKLYDVADGKIISEQVVGTMGAGHGALAGFLKNAADSICIWVDWCLYLSYAISLQSLECGYSLSP